MWPETEIFSNLSFKTCENNFVLRNRRFPEAAGKIQTAQRLILYSEIGTFKAAGKSQRDGTLHCSNSSIWYWFCMNFGVLKQGRIQGGGYDPNRPTLPFFPRVIHVFWNNLILHVNNILSPNSKRPTFYISNFEGILFFFLHQFYASNGPRLTTEHLQSAILKATR